MAEALQKPDQSESMEEILQSIKRIMEDEKPEEGTAEGENDVFNLTSVVRDDGTVAEIINPQNMIDELFASPPLPEPEKEILPELLKPPESKMEQALEPREEGLMSDLATDAAARAFRQIIEKSPRDYSIPRIPSPEFRSGNTVEDLVLEALRPMLKDWLDENLPVIVQKIVEKEVKRIVTKHYDL